MSIIKKRFSTAAVIFAEILLGFFIVGAQDLEIKVEIKSASDARVEGKLISEKTKKAIKNWSFLQSLGGAENLGGRISAFNLIDNQEQNISVKQLAAGEYLADTDAAAFQYRINLNSLSNIKAMAHVSWLEGERGILMLDDLLPRFDSGNQPVSAKIQFVLPADWKIITGEKTLGSDTFYVKNIESAIFAVGTNWREEKYSNLSLNISGEWQFSDAEAAKMANDILEEYRKFFGETADETVRIFLGRFPKETKFGRWEAETRGANLTIMSSDMPFKTMSLQRLHEQLRHELFHLWIPNKLALTGNYDWFYEGFTVYQALRTGVATNQIRFEDFLSTLAEAYNLDNLQTQKVSLIESSKNRWNGANPQVYARGMLVAFLCDLAMLKQSKNSHSIKNIFQEIYRQYRVPDKSADGNAAVLSVLKNYSELDFIVENYIKGLEKVNWETDLESVGIEAREENSFVKLSVKPKLSGKQKDLLDKLGYNNWRKSSEKLK